MYNRDVVKAFNHLHYVGATDPTVEVSVSCIENHVQSLEAMIKRCITYAAVHNLPTIIFDKDVPVEDIIPLERTSRKRKK